jgi:hypothetical protein
MKGVPGWVVGESVYPWILSISPPFFICFFLKKFICYMLLYIYICYMLYVVICYIYYYIKFILFLFILYCIASYLILLKYHSKKWTRPIDIPHSG